MFPGILHLQQGNWGGKRVLSGFIAGFAAYVLAGILTGIQLGLQVYSPS
ncbi:hypothetical protein [Methanothermobacter sp.]|nr:hypothetical protein [Methanothermobacter sp.]MDI9619124.1 hypothetical protein [Methanothermobacter sp.]